MISAVFALKARGRIARIVVVQRLSDNGAIFALAQARGIALGFAGTRVWIGNPVIGVSQVIFASEEAGAIGSGSGIIPEDGISCHEIGTPRAAIQRSGSAGH